MFTSSATFLMNRMRRSRGFSPRSDYTASNNAVRLDGFYVVNFDAGYRFGIGNGGDTSLRVGVNVFNIFNTDAVTEGSPRQDINQTVGGAYFVGRPVLPRRIVGRVTLNF